MPSRSWIPVVALFGAFAVTYNLAVIVHELGHFLVSWLTRGNDLTSWQILFHPFSVSYVWQNDWAILTDSTRAWILAGGMVTGIVVGASAVPVVRLAAPGSPLRLAGWMFVANSMMLNGMYLVTALLVPWGDVGTLLQFGVPRWIVAVIGGVTVAGWLLADVKAVLASGLAAARSAWATLSLSVAGVLAYPLLIVGWQLALEAEPQVPLAVYVFYAVAVAICMAIAAPVARRVRWPAARQTTGLPGGEQSFDAAGSAVARATGMHDGAGTADVRAAGMLDAAGTMDARSAWALVAFGVILAAAELAVGAITIPG